MYSDALEFLQDVKKTKKTYRYECENESFEIISLYQEDDIGSIYNIAQYNKSEIRPYYKGKISEKELVPFLNSNVLKRYYKNAKTID